MKALTVRQPYADAITWSDKRIENRSKPIPEKHLGTTILIHSGKELHASGITAADLGGEDWPDVRGAILGTALLAGCHRAKNGCCAPWGHPETPALIARQVWHWELDAVQHIDTPVAATGALSFWTPPDDALAAVEAQLQAVTR